MRFVVETAPVGQVARFVVGLGAIAEIESDEFREAVRILPGGALERAGHRLGRASGPA